MTKATKAEPKKTGEATHRATERGYAGGAIIEPGEPVPAGIPVSIHWMAPAGSKPAEPEVETPAE